MQVSLNAVLASIAVLAIAGVSGTAAARTRGDRIGAVHVETVRLPDGSLERIRYTGDRPPEVRFVPVSTFDIPDKPTGFFDFGAPFAQMVRMSAEIDRQAAAMMREVDRLDAAAFGAPGGPTSISFSDLPQGSEGYSEVSTVSGNHVCTETMRYFSAGPGKKPRVERTTSGDCHAGGLQHHAFRRMTPTREQSAPQPKAIRVGYRPSTGAAPHAYESVWHVSGRAN